MPFVGIAITFLTFQLPCICSFLLLVHETRLQSPPVAGKEEMGSRTQELYKCFML